jgi:HD-GYP domain-containing protein (c-di-GMP phosphodiesterase class II)
MELILQMRNALLTYLDLIEGIVAAMDARDAYTAKHSERVADITELICLIMELSENESENIHIAAHVHDIGKIGIPDYVLTKSSALTDNEWEIMKSHSEIGYRILERSAGFSEVAVIVRHHHERWDGKGYPLGLSAEEIPYGSRIIALADSIDAMLSDRKYRQAMSSEQCRTEIGKNAGIMYDPNIAAAVLKNWGLIEELIASAENCQNNNT